MGVETPRIGKRLPGALRHAPEDRALVALLRDERGLIAVYDPVFGNRLLEPEALDAEASGRFLVPAGRAPAGLAQALG